MSYAGPGLTIERAPLASGTQIARERIYVPRADGTGALELLYAAGDVIRDGDAQALGIVDGRLQTRDKADIAPSEKARRRATAQDKARPRATVEDKAVVLNG